LALVADAARTAPEAQLASALDRFAAPVDLELGMDGGGVVIGDRIQVFLEIEAILTSSPPADTGCRRSLGWRSCCRVDELNCTLVMTECSVG
jgi:hypothetical protein